MPLQGRILGGSASLLDDADYHSAAIRVVDRAVDRLWCSVFIIDPRPVQDPEGRVRELIRAVAGAVWRRADVRLLIGGSTHTQGIAEVCLAAAMIARNAGIPTRTLMSRETRGSHSKVLIADDVLVTGSHNWSGGAFSGGQTQDSVLIDSADLAALAVNAFLWQWRRASSV